MAHPGRQKYQKLVVRITCFKPVGAYQHRRPNESREPQVKEETKASVTKGGDHSFVGKCAAVRNHKGNGQSAGAFIILSPSPDNHGEENEKKTDQMEARWGKTKDQERTC